MGRQQKQMDVDSFRYVTALIRKWWLLVIGAVIAASAAFVFSAQQRVEYRAETRLLIGVNTSNSDLTLGQIEEGEGLAVFYAEIARSRPVLEPTLEQLGLGITYNQLRSAIGTQTITGTPILVLSVRSGTPDEAIAVVNTVAQNLVERVPSLTPEEQAQYNVLNELVDELQSQITITNQQAADVLEQINNATLQGNEAVLEGLSQRYNELVQQLNNSRATLAQSSNTLIELSDRANRLEIFEPATEAREETGLSPIIVTIAGALVGIILAAALVILLEYLNTNVRDARSIQQQLSIPVLGNVHRTGSIGNKKDHYLISAAKPELQIAEDFRNIATKIITAQEHAQGENIYIFTSPHGREGRTLVMSNISILLAEMGLRVLTIDADLRTPDIHSVFGLDNSTGLTRLLITSYEQMANSKKSGVRISRSRKYPNLGVMVSGLAGTEGNVPHRGFVNLPQWLNYIRNAASYDVILFDAPPALRYADTVTLATRLKARMIIVLEYNRTSMEDAATVRNRFVEVGIQIEGVIINKT